MVQSFHLFLFYFRRNNYTIENVFPNYKSRTAYAVSRNIKKTIMELRGKQERKKQKNNESICRIDIYVCMVTFSYHALVLKYSIMCETISSL